MDVGWRESLGFYFGQSILRIRKNINDKLWKIWSKNLKMLTNWKENDQLMTLDNVKLINALNIYQTYE